MTTSKWRGNAIYYSNGRWFYCSDNVKIRVDPNRACAHCGKENTPEGHDSCLGTLKGVINACCGHGNEKDAYVQFLSGSIVRGEEAIEIMNRLKESENYANKRT